MGARWGSIQSSGASLSRSGHWLGRRGVDPAGDWPAEPSQRPVSLAGVRPKTVPVERVSLPADLFQIIPEPGETR